MNPQKDLFIILINKVKTYLINVPLLIGSLSCKNNDEARNHLKFINNIDIVTNNIMRMDSLINKSSLSDNFQSCYLDHKDGNLVIYINDQILIKHDSSNYSRNTSCNEAKTFSNQFYDIANVLYKNKISLILAPCGFLEFVFYYSNDRGMYRSIIVKKKEYTSEIFKSCMRTKIGSTDRLWLLNYQPTSNLIH